MGLVPERVWQGILDFFSRWQNTPKEVNEAADAAEHAITLTVPELKEFLDSATALTDSLKRSTETTLQQMRERMQKVDALIDAGTALLKALQKRFADSDIPILVTIQRPK